VTRKKAEKDVGLTNSDAYPPRHLQRLPDRAPEKIPLPSPSARRLSSSKCPPPVVDLLRVQRCWCRRSSTSSTRNTAGLPPHPLRACRSPDLLLRVVPRDPCLRCRRSSFPMLPLDLLPRVLKTPQVFVGRCSCVVDVVLPIAFRMAPRAGRPPTMALPPPYSHAVGRGPCTTPRTTRRQVGGEAAFGWRRENS
jgi:hypothetical protein